MVLLFILLHVLLNNVIIVNGNDIHARQRRSNIPCGASFTPCSRSTLPLDLASNGVSDDEVQTQRNSFEAKEKGRHTDINKLINRRNIITTIEEARKEIDKLFNQTEIEIFERTNGIILENKIKL
ncbi:unnamed protein product, partial [Onchocerca flexuosa]|uniref:Uncharacterized protein n=1 Tax=Onchocerca flexuosa TaxID=387005 RepID=A0A183HHA5_9BILA